MNVAIACNNIEGLKLVLADPRIKNALSPFDDQLCTPLMTAVAYGQGKEAVRLLLRHPEVGVNQTNKGGHTALQYAAYLGHTGAVSLLLSHQDVDISCQLPGDDHRADGTTWSSVATQQRDCETPA